MDALAKVIAHEGDHGAKDLQRGRPIASRAERKEHEKSAYRTQAYFQKGMGFLDNFNNAWTPWGGLNEEAIDAQTEMSIIGSCGTSSEGSCQ